MEKAEIRQMINGPESFTPDMHAVLGEAPGVSHCAINNIVVSKLNTPTNATKSNNLFIYASIFCI